MNSLWRTVKFTVGWTITDYGAAAGGTTDFGKRPVCTRAAARDRVVPGSAAGDLRPPVALMAAASISAWPTGDGRLLEPKWDGGEAAPSGPGIPAVAHGP